MAHSSEFKRVSLETAAKTLSQFSPPELIFHETSQIADGNFGGLTLNDDEKTRLQEGAAEYRGKLETIKNQLSHTAILCIAIDQTSRRESGLYVDSSSIRFKPHDKSDDSYDFSVPNWEFSADGYRSRGTIITPSSFPEFGAWDIKYIKDASITNAVGNNGYFNAETLTIDNASDDSMVLGYSATSHDGNRPFHDAFRNAPGENL